MKSYKKYGLFLLVILLLVTCRKDEKIFLESVTETEIGEFEIFDHTRVIDNDAFEQQIVSIDSAQFTITTHESFVQQYSLSQGDIMVSAYGQGFLRRIDSLALNGDQYDIYTSQATLEESIKEGSVSHKQRLTPMMIEKVEYHQPGVKMAPVDPKGADGDTLKLEFSTDLGNQVNISGGIAMISDIVFELDVSWSVRLRKVNFGFEHETLSTVEIFCGQAFEFNPSMEIATYYFHPIVIPTLIPIVITPVVTITVGIDGKAEASISTRVTQEFNYQAGILYERGEGWSTYEDVDNNWDYQPPQATLEASLKGHITPDISLLLYGVIGAYLDASVYCELAVDALNDPWWILYAGYRVGLGAKATIFSVNLFDVHYPELIGSKWIIAQADEDPPALETGEVQGEVKDAFTGEGLEYVEVSVFRNQAQVASTQTQANGFYSITLPVADDYTFEFTTAGYLPAVYHNVEVEEDQITYQVAVLQIDEVFDGDGNVQGRILNAFDGNGISGADIVVRQGINAQQGQVVETTSSQSGGHYSLQSLPAGNYTVEVSKINFSTSFANIVCLGGQTTDNQNVSLTPMIGDDEIRIILDWGQTPADLDSHLTGPVPQSADRFHVYYGNRHFLFDSQLYVALDYDVVDSYGPETITIYQQTSGVYRYSVHDFTNRFSTDSYELSSSGARVRVYKGSDLVRTFNVPSNAGGTLWTVFEMTGDVITPVNLMDYEQSPSNITKDSDVILIQKLPEKK